MSVNPATSKPEMVTPYGLGQLRVPTGVESAYTWGMVQQNADQAVHEAARAGLADKLAEMLAMDTSLIDAKGNVTGVKVISGPVLLQQAAMETVRHWKYEPARLDGQAVAMHLTVTVRFRLN